MIQKRVLIFIALQSILFYSPLLAQTELLIENFEGQIQTQSQGVDDLAFLSSSGALFGVWVKDQKDKTQGCQLVFSKEETPLGEGTAIKLIYDVDSPFSAYNGFYIRLNGADLSNYDTLHLFLKGDANQGFTPRLKIEFKSSQKKHLEVMKELGLKSSPYLGQHASAFMLEGISKDWQEFSIPLKKFKFIRDWTDMYELVLVFDDVNSNPKAGVIYLDRIRVSGKARTA